MSTNKIRTSIKTTAHKRRIVLYLSCKELVEQWNKEADAAGLTTSKFIQGIVNNYFESGNVLKAQKAVLQQLEMANATIQHLRQENSELQKKVDMLDKLTDKYDIDIQQLKNQAFMTKDLLSGSRMYEKKLIDLLVKKNGLREHEIFDFLKIDPNDKKTILALQNQLQQLLEYGAIEIARGVYQWRR